MYQFLLSSLFVARILGCGSDVSGTTGANVQFDLHFLAPLGFTYSTSGTTYLGQSSSQDTASTVVTSTLKSAIDSALKENQIITPDSPSFSNNYIPPDVSISEDGSCKAENTYISYQGTVFYECVSAEDNSFSQEPFEQSMLINVNSTQALYKSQWDQMSRSVQKYFESQNMTVISLQVNLL